MKLDNNQKAFLALLREGLWADVGITGSGNQGFTEPIDWQEVYRLAEEQSVIGLVAAGLEKAEGGRLKAERKYGLTQEMMLTFVGKSLQIEQYNLAMNKFIAELVQELRVADIYTLIVKGQGIAQCYERPLWRTSGDVDFYMSEDDFEKAKIFFRPLVGKFDPDNDYTRHINMHYGSWVVEIHANQYCSLSSRINNVLDEIHENLFKKGDVRSWENGHTTIYLPSPNNDVLIIFTHFLKHFYNGGIGLRQICDWCRLLWRYRAELDSRLLESRIKKMGLLNVWKAFAAFAVEYLGMPVEAMPFFSDKKRWKEKARRITGLIFETGNFGHNRDISYYVKYPYVIKKIISFWRHTWDSIRQFFIFPVDSTRVWGFMISEGVLELQKNRKL